METRTAFQYATLVIVYVVTPRIIKHHIHRKVLPTQIGEDIPIKIGIRITYHLHVARIDFMVSIPIDELHITRTEISLHPGLIHLVKPCGLGLRRRRKHAVGLVTIEYTGRPADL